MTQTTTDAQALSDLFAIADLDWQTVCDWGPEFVSPETPDCKQPARWIFYFGKMCRHGSPMEPPYVFLTCDEHRRLFISMFRSARYTCTGCGCIMIDVSHVTERISPL